MDSKRKSYAPAGQGRQRKRAKVKDMDHHPGSNGLTDRTAITKGDTTTRLSPLRETVQDIMDSRESIQTHATESGPNVITAAAELNKAFCARESPSPAIADPTHINYAIKAHEGFDIAKNKTPGSLPPLPPVSDPSLESAVFTHPGVGNNNEANYDRLEILGDAYIELMATKLVWHKFQELSSGRISQIRESLVKNETLSEFATRYGLDARASVPRDYLSQPKRWTKTKGDIFEAYVAAVILSNPRNGYKIAENWLTALWMPLLSTTDGQAVCLHAKETLAKRVMGKGIKLKYTDERPPIQLEGGKQTFFIGVYITGWGWNNKHLGSGQGFNKVMAGNQAAGQALSNNPVVNEIIAMKQAHEAEKRRNNSST